jgi:hypothetical protein
METSTNDISTILLLVILDNYLEIVKGLRLKRS